MEPAQFPIGDLFQEDDSGDEGSEAEGFERGVRGSNTEAVAEAAQFVVRVHVFPGENLMQVREFAFHACNANLLWPGALAFAEWLWQRPEVLKGQKVLELGSGTGALAIFLSKHMGCDITTSDYNDPDIQDNILANCKLNSVDGFPHIPHTWGDPFPAQPSPYTVVIASDILLYVKQYANLIRTLQVLLKLQYTTRDAGFVRPVFMMSWRRRIPKEDINKFFDGCLAAGLSWRDLGSRVFEISQTLS